MDLNTKLITVDEVTEFLKVPRSWVYYRTKLKGSAQLPHVKCGRYIRFEAEKVIKWLESNQEN